MKRFLVQNRQLLILDASAPVGLKMGVAEQLGEAKSQNSLAKSR
jgi:hypothetical protein